MSDDLRQLAIDMATDVIDCHRQWCGRCAIDQGTRLRCGDREAAEAALIKFANARPEAPCDQ